MREKAEITVEEAGKMLKKDAQWVRLGLIQKRFEWGDAVQMKTGHWSYKIYPIKFYRHLGYEGRKLEDEKEREKIKAELLEKCA